jgi:hypothetical protein
VGEDSNERRLATVVHEHESRKLQQRCRAGGGGMYSAAAISVRSEKIAALAL